MSAVEQPPAPYGDFDRMLIGGTWRHGSSEGKFTDTNPYSGAVLTEIPLSNAEDVDSAYQSAQAAQRD